MRPSISDESSSYRLGTVIVIREEHELTTKRNRLAPLFFAALFSATAATSVVATQATHPAKAGANDGYASRYRSVGERAGLRVLSAGLLPLAGTLLGTPALACRLLGRRTPLASRYLDLLLIRLIRFARPAVEKRPAAAIFSKHARCRRAAWSRPSLRRGNEGVASALSHTVREPRRGTRPPPFAITPRAARRVAARRPRRTARRSSSHPARR